MFHALDIPPTHEGRINSKLKCSNEENRQTEDTGKGVNDRGNNNVKQAPL